MKTYALIPWHCSHQGWAENGILLIPPAAAAAADSQVSETPGTKYAITKILPSHPCSKECLLSMQDPLVHYIRFCCKMTESDL